MPTNTRSLFASYGLAAITYFTAAMFTSLFWDSLFGDVPFALFFAAVSITAWFGGFWPAFLVALSGAVTIGFFISTPDKVTISAPLTLLGVAALISYLIQQRERAEESERQGEALFSSVFRASPVSISITRLSDGKYVDVNKAFLDRYGISREDVIGRNSIELNLWVDPEERLRMISRLRDQGRIDNFEAQFQGRSGEPGTVLLSAEIIELNGEEYMLSIGHDITQRKKAGEALLYKEMLLRETGEIAKVGGWEFDPITGQGHWTEEVARIHDLDPNAETSKEIGLSFYQGESRLKIEAAVEAAIERGTPYDLELEIRTTKGEPKWVRTICRPIIENGKVVRVRGSLQDITERKRAEETLRSTQEQLLQAQKMEAVGRLAGGVAHDFNNLLTAIIGYSQLALQSLPPQDSLRQDIDEIRKAGERAANLTRQLLAFSRKQLLQPRILDINTVVAETSRMLNRLIGADILFRTTLDPGLRLVKVDPGQIEQVLMNLAVNARDAMPDGGRLSIETANVYLDEEYARHHAEVEPGPYIMLAVSDTGCGIDSETLAHIFEPFFTTKEQGKGTGLGLATVYGIVKQSGGHIWVYSESGKGATFKVYLPQVIEEASISTEAIRTELLPGGSESILLAEDDEQVRTFAGRVLSELGYKVIESTNGEEALSEVGQESREIDMLVTDVVMPQIGGKELSEYVRNKKPGMKVLFLSGYTADAIVNHGVLDEGVPFLHKPFTPGELARKVREVLDGAP